MQTLIHCRCFFLLPGLPFRVILYHSSRLYLCSFISPTKMNFLTFRLRPFILLRTFWTTQTVISNKSGESKPKTPNFSAGHNAKNTFTHLFSIASMFLSSKRSCHELSPLLSEKSRWWPVTHSVPFIGAWNGCFSTTSSTFAVLICSENSIDFSDHYAVKQRTVETNKSECLRLGSDVTL